MLKQIHQTDSTRRLSSLLTINITTTVMTALVLLLLCSGFSHITSASNRLRIFRFPEANQTEWQHALKKCNETDESFVTLYDEEDAAFTATVVENELPKGNKTVWLGLSTTDGEVAWSNGDPVNKSSVTLRNGTQICEAIDNNTRKGFKCSDMKPFMCYKDNKYTLIENNRTWCKALQYCRKHFDDLVSLSNKAQHGNVIQEGKNTSFWIGLMHDEWQWEDKGCSSFSNWSVTGNVTHCTAYKSFPPSFHKTECGGKAHYFCSKGYMRIRVITHTDSTWEEAFDYCRAHHTNMLWIEDEEDQKAVVQWLNNTNVGGGPFWIAMRQSRLFGFWIWSDRTVSWSNWKNGTQPEPSILNQCGVINKDDYTWSGAECGRRLPFLCEEEIVYMNK